MEGVGSRLYDNLRFSHSGTLEQKSIFLLFDFSFFLYFQIPGWRRKKFELIENARVLSDCIQKEKAVDCICRGKLCAQVTYAVVGIPQLQNKFGTCADLQCFFSVSEISLFYCFFFSFYSKAQVFLLQPNNEENVNSANMKKLK